MDVPLCILSDAEKDQKREYAKRYPQSVAFVPNLIEDDISLEQCLLEFKLESVVEESTKLVAARRAAYLAAPGTRTSEACQRFSFWSFHSNRL